MSNREFDSDFDRTTRVGGRRFAPREGRNEFLRPTYWNGSRAGLLKGVLAFIGLLAIVGVVVLLLLV